jgi:hypothetical protein
MPAATKIEDGDELTEEILQDSLRRGLGWMSALQAEDGHWPGDFSGIMYLMPFWVRYISYSYYVSSISRSHALALLACSAVGFYYMLRRRPTYLL